MLLEALTKAVNIFEVIDKDEEIVKSAKGTISLKLKCYGDLK